MKRDLKVISILILLIEVLSACGPGIENTPSPAALPAPTIMTSPSTPDLPPGEVMQIYTTQNNLLGNHLSEGSIDLPNASTIDIPLDRDPLWLASAPFEDGAVFAVLLEDGQTKAFQVTGKTYEPIGISPPQIPAGMPPLLAVSETTIQWIVPPPDASPLTNPLLVGERLVFIADNGDLVFSDSMTQIRLSVDALPDARLLLLTGPTNRYNHGVLGDELEASAVTLIETEPEVRVIRNITIPAPDVVEGIAPIWADIDEDGVREIIVTLSNNQGGARIAAYREDGSLLAETPPIGLGIAGGTRSPWHRSNRTGRR